ncbi:MAG: glycosyltransferase [Candidatus Altiarchaeales archaeon]|nr:glycosyltransferase [Candidatus Altiarchaeales archaeon]
MKVQIYVCGEGLGHASRSLAVGDALIELGHEVSFHAYGSSKRHIESNGFKAAEIPPELTIAGKDGSLEVGDTIKATLASTRLLALPRIVSQVRKGKPGAIISDSYFLAVIAARLQKVPAYFIVNQTNTYNYLQSLGVKGKAVSVILKYFMEKAFHSVKKIVIPDFPQPWTICAKSIHDLGDLLYYSGPLVGKMPEDVEAAALRKPHVLSLVGGFGYREKLLLKMLDVAKENTGVNFMLLAGPNIDQAKLDNHLGNVNVVQYLPNIFSYLKSTDIVVTHGGHSTLMECLTYGVPLISFPDMKHYEQENNAEQLDYLKLGRKLSYNTPPLAISKTINDMLADSTIRKNCLKMMEYSKKLDGPNKLAKLIEEEA